MNEERTGDEVAPTDAMEATSTPEQIDAEIEALAAREVLELAPQVFAGRPPARSVEELANMRRLANLARANIGKRDVPYEKRRENDQALRKMARVEAVQAELAHEMLKRINHRVTILMNEIERIVRHPTPNDTIRVPLINKLLDKILPATQPLKPIAQAERVANVQIVIHGVDRGRRPQVAIEQAPQEQAPTAQDAEHEAI